MSSCWRSNFTPDMISTWNYGDNKIFPPFHLSREVSAHCCGGSYFCLIAVKMTTIFGFWCFLIFVSIPSELPASEQFATSATHFNFLYILTIHVLQIPSLRFQCFKNITNQVQTQGLWNQCVNVEHIRKIN